MYITAEYQVTYFSLVETASAGNAAEAAGQAPGANRAADGQGGNDGGAAGTQLSTHGQLLSQLQALEQADPALAQQILSGVADSLRAEAVRVGGVQADRLKALADKVQQAADTGDLSGLDPAGGHQHHHHHLHHAYGQGQSDHGVQGLDQLLRRALDAASVGAQKSAPSLSVSASLTTVTATVRVEAADGAPANPASTGVSVAV